MIDIIKFGKKSESQNLQNVFTNEVTDKFIFVTLEHINDHEGNKTIIELSEKKADEFYDWLIAYDWYDYSENIQAIKKTKKDDYDLLLKRSAQSYPDKFDDFEVKVKK